MRGFYEKKFFAKALVVFAILLSWDCSKDTNPIKSNNEIINEEENFSGNLEITTEKSTYTIGEVTAENFVVIQAALVNTTQDTFYTNLGDRMNASIDQEYLLIAQFTDGYFEKNVSKNKWDNLDIGSMIEGSGIIRILPSKKYNLTAAAHLSSDIQGKFRLRINYYRNNSKTALNTFTDASNTFYINKQ